MAVVVLILLKPLGFPLLLSPPLIPLELNGDVDVVEDGGCCDDTTDNGSPPTLQLDEFTAGGIVMGDDVDKSVAGIEFIEFELIVMLIPARTQNTKNYESFENCYCERKY